MTKLTFRLDPTNLFAASPDATEPVFTRAAALARDNGGFVPCALRFQAGTAMARFAQRKWLEQRMPVADAYRLFALDRPNTAYVARARTVDAQSEEQMFGDHIEYLDATDGGES